MKDDNHEDLDAANESGAEGHVDASSQDQECCEPRSRRWLIRAVTALGLGHITVLTVGNSASGKPTVPQYYQCGIYDPETGRLIQDVNCGQTIPGGQGHFADSDCGQKIDPSQGNSVAADNRCGIQAPNGRYYNDGDCGLQQFDSGAMWQDNHCGLGAGADLDCGLPTVGGTHSDDTLP